MNSCITFTQQGHERFNPIRPGLFSRLPGPGGPRDPDAKNQGYHQLTELKFCISHYSHKSMPDAKFECGSLSSFGDMMLQNLPLKKGTRH